MKSYVSRVGLFLASLLLASGTALAQTPTFSLQAVTVNDVVITPSNSITVKPGDTIVAEIFVSDWSPVGQRLLSYQADISRLAFDSGATGAVTPVGWDRPIAGEDDINCDPVTPCPVEYPVCQPAFGERGYCVGSNYDPEQGVFIDPSRMDWFFTDPSDGSPLPGFSAVDRFGPLRYGALLLVPSDARTYTSPPKYCGTLKLEVSDDTSGTFDFEIDVSGGSNSELIDEQVRPILPLVAIGLTIVIDPCGNGVIDAGEACDGEDLGACAGACADDCSCAPVGIPTASAWGLTALALSLLAVGRAYFGRRWAGR